MTCAAFAVSTFVYRYRSAVVLADQVKSLDWRVRGAVKKGAVSKEALDEVLAKLGLLIGAELPA
jgi:mRNA-degrading endonuclease toxin of MazEF toxin-antitoxin module